MNWQKNMQKLQIAFIQFNWAMKVFFIARKVYSNLKSVKK